MLLRSRIHHRGSCERGGMMADMATRTASSVVPSGADTPNSWGLGDGQAIPWEYAPAPEARDVVRLKERYGLFINGREVAATGGETFASIDPSTELPLAAVAKATEVDIDKAVRAARRAQRRSWGQLSGRERAKYLFRISRILQERSREFAVLESMDSGKPIKESRDVDVPLAASHFWYYAGWADKLDYAFPGRVARPARRRRPDHPVELPAADAGVEDRPGPRRRQHRRPQAGIDHAAQRAAVRRRVRPGGPAAGHRQHRHRTRRRGDAPRDPSRGRQGGVHRLDRDRPQDLPGRGRHRQGADPGARWQGGQHRVRRRAARPGGRGHRQRHLLQPGRGLLRGLAAARPGVDRGAARSTSSRTASRPSVSAIRWTRTPTSGRSTRRASWRRSPSWSRAGSTRGRTSISRPATCPTAATSSARPCSPTSPRAIASRARRSSGRCCPC